MGQKWRTYKLKTRDEIQKLLSKNMIETSKFLEVNHSEWAVTQPDYVC